jgi:flagellar biosynthesis/type III secretory pathway protein FliH
VEDEFDPNEFGVDAAPTEVVPVEQGTDPHAKSAEWLAGFEVGRAEGLKVGKEEGCKACHAEGQEDAVIALESMFHSKKAPEDEIKAVVLELRRRFTKL